MGQIHEVTKGISAVPEVGQTHAVTKVTSAVPEVGQILSDIPKQGSVSSVAEKAKKKKKWKSKNPAILKRRRQKRQEQRAQWRLEVRETLKTQVAEVMGEEPTPGTSLSPVDDTLKRRTYYEEWLPSAIGTYYRAGPPNNR